MLLAAAMILAGLLLTREGYDAFFLMAGGIAASVTTAARRWHRNDGPEKDERTAKIHAFCLPYSWLLSIILILATFAATKMGIISLDATTALSITMFIMAGSAVVLLAILHRRGDVYWS